MRLSYPRMASREVARHLASCVGSPQPMPRWSGIAWKLEYSLYNQETNYFAAARHLEARFDLTILAMEEKYFVDIVPITMVDHQSVEGRIMVCPRGYVAPEDYVDSGFMEV